MSIFEWIVIGLLTILALDVLLRARHPFGVFHNDMIATITDEGNRTRSKLESLESTIFSIESNLETLNVTAEELINIDKTLDEIQSKIKNIEDIESSIYSIEWELKDLNNTTDKIERAL